MRLAAVMKGDVSLEARRIWLAEEYELTEGSLLCGVSAIQCHLVVQVRYLLTAYLNDLVGLHIQYNLSISFLTLGNA